MNNDMSNLYLEPIEAVIPTYDSHGGNASQIIYSNGEVQIVPMCVLKFIEKWFWHSFKAHITGHRLWGSEVVKCRNLSPLVAHEDIIMVPVKTRAAYGSKDGCYGYIRLNSLLDFDKTTIFLHSGAKIPYSSATQTLEHKLLSAKLLHYTYKEESMVQQENLIPYRAPKKQLDN